MNVFVQSISETWKQNPLTENKLTATSSIEQEASPRLDVYVIALGKNYWNLKAYTLTHHKRGDVVRSSFLA